MDLSQFRANVTNLVKGFDQISDEEFHKQITSWQNEVSMAKLKAAADEVGKQLYGALVKIHQRVKSRNG